MRLDKPTVEMCDDESEVISSADEFMSYLNNRKK